VIDDGLPADAIVGTRVAGGPDNLFNSSRNSTSLCFSRQVFSWLALATVLRRM
jgi:hypothetical protein